MLPFVLATSKTRQHILGHDKDISQEVVGVLGVEEVEGEEGVAELGPIAVVRKGEGVS